MKSLIQRLLGGKSQPVQTSRKNRQRPSLLVEALESRTLMSTTAPVIVPGVISDNNFTSPALAAKSYVYDPAGTPWTYCGQSGMSSDASGFTAGNPCAPAGTQVAFLQGTGAISHAFSVAPGSYCLTFADAQRGNVQSHFQAINVLVDSKLVDVVIPTCTQYATHQTPNFTLTGTGTHTLQFQGVNPISGDNTAFLTQVNIDNAVATGNPTESALMGQALGNGTLNYGVMMGLFNTVEADGVVSTAELQSLQTFVADANLLHMPADVANLADKVVNGDGHNATYRTIDAYGHVVNTPLGNLQAGNTVWQLSALVNKWFVGMDYPATEGTDAYKAAQASLFNPNTGKPSPDDVHQGGLGDCWLMAPLKEAAVQTPAIISSMFTYEGCSRMEVQSTPVVTGKGGIISVPTSISVPVNVWSVRLYQNGVPTYVTVDSELPGAGTLYDQVTNDALWAALAEKAYAQLNTGSYGGLDHPNNSNIPLAEITGRDVWSRSYYTHNGDVISTSGTSLSLNTVFGGPTVEVTTVDHLSGKVSDAFAAGQLVVFCTVGSPSNSNLEGSHMYAVLSIAPNCVSFTLGNPWGCGDSSGLVDGKPAVVTLSKNDLFNNSCYLGYTMGSSPASATSSTSTSPLAASAKGGAAGVVHLQTAATPQFVAATPNVGQVVNTVGIEKREQLLPFVATKAETLAGNVMARAFAQHHSVAMAADLTSWHLDAAFADDLFVAEVG